MMRISRCRENHCRKIPASEEKNSVNENDGESDSEGSKEES